MINIHNGQQKQEIETICKRTLELELSDADIMRIAKKAGAHGLTISNLIENFLGDLVYGTYSNGSDERMHAQEWFERCWFANYPNLTFLRYLIESGGIDDVLELLDDLQNAKEELADIEANSEKYEPEDLSYMREDMAYCQEQLNNYWNRYNSKDKDYTPISYDEEMKKVRQWRNEYKKILK